MGIKSTTITGLLVLLLVSAPLPSWAESAGDSWEKVVFHLDDASNARWAMLLANSYLDDNPKAKAVFVAYGPGIDFLLQDAEDRRGNPFDPAVIGLVERGVEFRLCAGTLSARGIAKENVLDAAVIVDSGIAEIARLQLKEGYAYLKP
jgi:intracellular sulfur oxidation DsrE/DsrF family protein